MAVTVKQIEATTDESPDTRSVALSAAAAALDPAIIWQRLESYIAYRWTERAVEWIVEGPGEWSPPLSPATIETVEVWSRGANEWENITPDASPLGGYWLSSTGPFRFTGTVGDDDIDVPAGVLEAFRRLAEYMAADAGTAGARREETKIGGDLSISISRSESWMAAALQNSGAADLLRTFRRAA